MASSNACWGIELGSGSIKAMKLVRDGEGVRLADFVVTPHKKVLSTPELNQDDAMRLAIGILMSQHDLSKASIAISAPGHSALMRFTPLPPVEPKKVANVVKYEAVQQIPFPLEEVEWDYQTFMQEDSPEVEVGIFAMTRERVTQKLNLCSDAELSPDILNLSPISVFNAMAYDLPIGADTPGTAIIDIGTVATDLIVADAGRVWVRTFPIGGHNFTEAIVSAFKLPYGKAEKLKCEAEKSKHKKHIFQAMRPVFTDLAQEVQRSISFYNQLHPESEIKRVIGLGSTFRLIGLRKYLSQQLRIDVSRCERFHQLQVDGTAEAEFQAVTLGMATAYGLALQGLGLAAIDANLVPVQVVREGVWKRKTPLFATAAVLSLVAGGASFIRPMLDSQQVKASQSQPELRQVQQVIQQGKQLSDEWRKVSQGAQVGFAAENALRMFERRDLYAKVTNDVASMLALAPPTDDDGFEVKDLRIEYQTPSGGSPEWITVAGGGRQSSPARRGRPGRGGGPSSGGGGLMGGGQRGNSGANPRPRPRAQGERHSNPSQPYGSFIITLMVESSNPDRSAFVDRTLLQWLRSHADDAMEPYTLTAPNADEITIRKVDEGGSGGRSGRTPTRSAVPKSSDSSGKIPTTLDNLAPLPMLQTQKDSGVSRFEYVITWKATLKAPTKPIDVSAASTQEGAL